MEFLFLTASNVPLFTRSDAETATWQAEEMSLRLLFPYDKDKPAERGMRVFFRDADGAIQPYEIRKVRNFEPDHYQEITAEHIAISELTDRIFTQTDFDDVTAGSILSSLLTGTGWSVGNDTSSGTSSLKLSNTTVWDAIANLRTNWNVYITPRVTFTAAGITGKYLDIAPAAGIWNGLRLSINKNADDLGVTYDDTAVKTAIYGYGKQITEGSGSTAVKTITTFADTVWTATAEHPAKPAGQTYVEDPQATALYGRDGTPRFSFYQNSDIDDPALLLQKSWEYLKTVREPKVTIDCTIRDLYRLGYTDQPVRLHDIALVDVEPLGITLHREIIKLSIDLLDPLQTQVTIGDYIPNIVYIAKQTSHSASGGGGGGGQTAKEYKESKF
ncbi:MAG: phage tail protein, partial [Clostridia bacterium]|nr:phage tail protein [Clostridia bacterium]